MNWKNQKGPRKPWAKPIFGNPDSIKNNQAPSPGSPGWKEFILRKQKSTDPKLGKIHKERKIDSKKIMENISAECNEKKDMMDEIGDDRVLAIVNCSTFRNYLANQNGKMEIIHRDLVETLLCLTSQEIDLLYKYYPQNMQMKDIAALMNLTSVEARNLRKIIIGKIINQLQ
ncbi:MAG: hypothetical protein PHF35_00315 [Candidatus Moranbacteria bacterium]|nr:hypothetical protein [Candidatus Moranbacteria bacterium]